MSSLYLLVLVKTDKIRSLRDLRVEHLGLLRNVRQKSEKAAMDKYGIDSGELRFFVHYQPTYCKPSASPSHQIRQLTLDHAVTDHFHVHVVR